MAAVDAETVKAGPRPPAEAMGLPGYAWDQRMRRGRGAFIDLTTGRMVGQKDIEGLLRDVIDVSEQAMREFGRMAAQGEMTPNEFYEAMRVSVRQAMNASTALSKGGWQNVTQADWGRNGWLLRQQYEYLAGMAGDLATEQTPAGTRGRLTPEQAQARAMLYADSAWGRFWELEDEKERVGGLAGMGGSESKIQTVGDDRVCEICLAEQAQGYRPLSATPALPIHPGCRCKKLYRRGNGGVGRGMDAAEYSRNGRYGRRSGTTGAQTPVGYDRGTDGPTKHYGPGDHPGGSPQAVHGHDGGVSAAAGDEPDTTTASGEAGATGSAQAEAARQQVLAVHGRYAPDLARLKAEADKWQREEEQAKSAFSAAINRDEVKVGTDEYERRRDGVSRLRSLKEEADRKWRELHGRELSEILPVLVVEDPMTLQVEYHSRFDAARKQAIAEGVGAFERLTSRWLLPAGAKPVADFKLGGKGRSTYDDGIVRVTTTADGVDVAHELGHWLEAVSPAIHERCVKFYEERTQGWPLQKLRAVTRNPKYKPGEVTRVDKFINPYMGREYVHGNRRYATEILSMGIEHFADKPGELAAGDPEYFRFIYDLLRGEL